LLATTRQRTHTISDLVHVEFVGNEIYHSPAVKHFRTNQLFPNYAPTTVSNILSYQINE
jgi:hypothetical protein